MRVLAVANEKGGVGKSAVVCNLAAELAALGHRVLVVDLDPQGSSTVGLGVEAPGDGAGSMALLADRPPAIEGIASPSSVSGVDVLGTDLHLGSVEWDVLTKGGAGELLLNVREALRVKGLPWDYALIDTPPSLGLFTVSALAAADRLLVPVAPEGFSFIGLRLLKDRLDGLRFGQRFGVRMLGAVRSMWDPRTRLARTVEAHVEQLLPGRLLATQIRRAVVVGEAMVRGVPVRQVAAGSAAAEAFQSLAAEVIEKW